MNLFLDTHVKFLKELLKAEVEFVVIGGYSVIFHGHTRTTGDLDVFLKPDNSNRDKLIKALAKFGIEEESLQGLSTLDFTKTIFFKIGKEPDRIDFLTKINLVAFDEADKQKVLAEINGLQIPFLHINHLILSKINTGRTQDQADIEMLQNIHKAGSK